jgi:hypothetical protein
MALEDDPEQVVRLALAEVHAGIQVADAGDRRFGVGDLRDQTETPVARV